MTDTPIIYADTPYDVVTWIVADMRRTAQIYRDNASAGRTKRYKTQNLTMAAALENQAAYYLKHRIAPHVIRP